jgi:hypothetical protein
MVEKLGEKINSKRLKVTKAEIEGSSLLTWLQP